jgi:DNA-binding NtrC family response regulator
MFQHQVESVPRRVEAVISAKEDQLHINAHDFGMRCSTSRCPHTFGHVLYDTMHERLYQSVQYIELYKYKSIWTTAEKRKNTIVRFCIKPFNKAFINCVVTIY